MHTTGSDNKTVPSLKWWLAAKDYALAMV